MTRALDLSSLPEAFFAPGDDVATIEVTGADRQSWLNGLVTSNLAPLKPGQGSYALATSKVGKILADLVVLVAHDRLLVGCPPSRLSALLQSFEGYLIMEDVELRDASAEHGWLFVRGAGASRAAEAAAGAVGGRWCAIDMTGLGDAALVFPAGAREQAAGALGEQARAITAAEWDALRIEHGTPRFGVDFDEKTYPQEASLERRAVSFCKGCYLGQEVICRLEMRGHVHRRLALLHVEGEAAAGAPVATVEGVEVGAITSATWSPGLGKLVALAMLKYAQSEPGTALQVGAARAVVAGPAAR